MVKRPIRLSNLFPNVRIYMPTGFRVRGPLLILVNMAVAIWQRR